MEKIRLNLNKSKKKLKQIMSKFSIILRWVLKPASLDANVEQRVKILASLLDTDVFFDENIWGREEALRISQLLSKSVFLCTRVFYVPKNAQFLSVENKNIMMPREGESLDSDNKKRKVHFEIGLETRYRISIVPIDLSKINESAWHRQLIADLFRSKHFGILTKKHGVVIPLCKITSETDTLPFREIFESGSLTLQTNQESIKFIYGEFVSSIVKMRIKIFLRNCVVIAKYSIKYKIMSKMEDQQISQFADLYQIYKSMWSVLADQEQVNSLALGFVMENETSSSSLVQSNLESKANLLISFQKIIKPLTSLNLFFDVSSANKKSRKLLEEYSEEIEEIQKEVETTGKILTPEKMEALYPFAANIISFLDAHIKYHQTYEYLFSSGKDFCKIIFNLENVTIKVFKEFEENVNIFDDEEYDSFRKLIIAAVTHILLCTKEYERIGEEKGQFRGAKRSGLLSILYETHKDFLEGSERAMIDKHLIVNSLANCFINMHKSIETHFNDPASGRNRFANSLKEMEETECALHELTTRQFITRGELVQGQIKIYQCNFYQDEDPSLIETKFEPNPTEENIETERRNELTTQETDEPSIKTAFIPFQLVKDQWLRAKIHQSSSSVSYLNSDPNFALLLFEFTELAIRRLKYHIHSTTKSSEILEFNIAFPLYNTDPYPGIKMCLQLIFINLSYIKYCFDNQADTIKKFSADTELHLLTP